MGTKQNNANEETTVKGGVKVDHCGAVKLDQRIGS
jgi:hypothetical protein